MTETQNIYQNFVPLNRVVNAAALDMYADIGTVKQVYSHWACRGLFELDMQILKGGKRSVLLHVNSSTHTATLPADYNGEIFVGIIKDGIKHPLRLDTGLADTKNIIDIPCEDICPKCNANKAICEDLQITTETTTVEINATNYEQTVTKKLYPSGDYYLESVIPFFDIENSTVVYRTSKEFVAHIDLKPCGCVEETESNIATIQVCSPDVYCNYFAPCGCAITDIGGYSIFEESGLIQFSPNFKHNQIYLEYRASMVKVNGQYQVPKIAFETLVEWIKYKAVQNKRNVSRTDKNDQWEHYRISKRNLTIVKTRGSLANLIRALRSTPKFDIYLQDGNNYGCKADLIEVASVPTNICDDSGTVSGSGSSGTVTTGYVPFSFGVIVGATNSPSDNSSVWQSDSLKGAINLNSFILNDTNYTLVKGDFTFDSGTGTIDITPNKFFTGDALLGNYFKKL